MAKNYGVNPLQLGASMQDMMYKNKAALPTEEDAQAQLFSDMGKSFSAPGDRPRGGWRNLGAGIAKGLEYGAKSRGAENKREDYDKYESVMNYFQEANNAAADRVEWYEKREMARQEYLPQVLAYADNIDKLDPQSQRIMAQGILEGYGRTLGEDYKLSSIDGSNPFLMTIQSSKGQQLFDVRSLFAGDKLLQERLAMKTPEYQLKLQQERQDKQKEFNLKQESVDIKKFEKGIPGGQFGSESAQFGSDSANNFEFNGQRYDAVPLRGLEKTEKSDYGKMVNKAVTQIGTNENALKSINSMREVFARNPNIGESWVNMLNDEESWSTLVAKNIGLVSRQERADMEILKKASSDLNLSTVLGVPGKAATDLLKQTIKSAAPSGTLTKQAFDKIANEWEERALSNIDMAKAQAQARSQGKMIVSKKTDQANIISPEEDAIWNEIGTPVQ